MRAFHPTILAMMRTCQPLNSGQSKDSGPEVEFSISSSPIQPPTSAPSSQTTSTDSDPKTRQLPATNLQLPTTNSQLPATNSQLPATNSQLPTTNSQLPATNLQLPATNTGLPSQDFARKTDSQAQTQTGIYFRNKTFLNKHA